MATVICMNRWLGAYSHNVKGDDVSDLHIDAVPLRETCLRTKKQEDQSGNLPELENKEL